MGVLPKFIPPVFSFFPTTFVISLLRIVITMPLSIIISLLHSISIMNVRTVSVIATLYIVSIYPWSTVWFL